MNKHEHHPCTRCGRPMVAQLAFGCLPGGHNVTIPLGYVCTNLECAAAERLEYEERDRQAIQRAVDRGVINP